MDGSAPSGLAWQIDEHGDCTVVTLAGDLDEHANFDDLRLQLAGRVIFDVDGVRRINSGGVHRWVDFMRCLQFSDLWFVRCRPVFLTQLALIYGFAGPGKVASLYAPYICERCAVEVMELQNAADLESSRAQAPFCPRCSQSMVLDEDPTRYLAFLARDG